MQKPLILLELGGVMGFAHHMKSSPKDLGIYSGLEPNKLVKQYYFYHRPQFYPFLKKYLIGSQDKYDMAIWTSLNKELAEIHCEGFMGKLIHKLLFIKCAENTTCGPVSKDLSIITAAYPKYNAKNIAVISCHANLCSEYSRNDILIPEYTPFGFTDLENDRQLEYLSIYLKVLHESKAFAGDDIRARINYISLESIKRKLSRSTRPDQFTSDKISNSWRRPD